MSEPGQHGPVSEQLDLAEDCERLCAIADLILSGEARVCDFELTGFELTFLYGYMNGGRS